MSRPRTEIGTYGKITTREVAPGLHESRARFRKRNGRLALVSRRGPSIAAAERKLKKAMTRLADEVDGKKISGDTRLGHVMDLWLAGLEDKVNRGKRAPKTLYDYTDTIRNHLRPRMGELTCREAENPGLCNEVLKDIRDASAATKKRGKTGTAGMLRARTVLSGVCSYALLHGAMSSNPVKAVEEIERDKNDILVLEPDQRKGFLQKLTAWTADEAAGRHGDPKKSRKYSLGERGRAWLDLPDIVVAELSTGCRPGEALALVGDSVDLDARKVVADHHLVRRKGQGIHREPKRKGGRDAVEAPIPSWALSMWRRRKLASGGGPLFPSWNGQWEDPSNVAKRIAKACEEIGFGWVSARILRHTAGTHLVDSGLTSADAADALGNTVDVIEAHYRRKRKANPRVAAAMESLIK